MAYRFKPGESLERAFRCVGQEQVDRIQALPLEDRAVWVHEARKGLKRLQALLRLVRRHRPGDDWRAINERVGQTKRSLSTVRDAEIRRATLAQIRRDASPRLRSALDAVTEVARAEVPSCAAATAEIAAVRAQLEEISSALGSLALPDPSRVLTDGLRAAHRKGRRALRRAEAEPSDETMHDLRKAAQLHWRLMRLLGPAWPDLFDARVEAARRLSQQLGDDHDLAVLAVWVHDAAAPSLTAAGRQQIVAECRKRQALLRAPALSAAALLFATKPRRFAAEICAYWGLAERSARTSEAKRGRNGRRPAAQQ